MDVGYALLKVINQFSKDLYHRRKRLLTRERCDVECSASILNVTQGASFVSGVFGCFRCEGVRENTLSLSSSLVKEREGTLHLYPSFSYTPETAEHAGHERSALKNNMYSGRPFGPMLEVCDLYKN